MAYYDEQIIGAKQQAETARKLREGYKSPEGSMVSGWYVPPSITQNLAELLKVYMGKRREESANEKLANILKDKQAATEKWMGNMPAPKEYAAVPEQVTPTYESGTNQMVANALRGGQEPQMQNANVTQQDPSMLSALIRGEQPQQMPIASVQTPVQTGQTVTPAQPARTEQVTPEQRMQWIMQGNQIDPQAAGLGAKYMEMEQARESAKQQALATMQARNEDRSLQRDFQTTQNDANRANTMAIAQMGNQARTQAAQEKLDAKNQAAQQAKDQQALSTQQVLDQAALLYAHPGREAGTGASSFMGMIPATDAKGFQSQLETFKAQTFIPMVSALKGMGALSDAEGKKLSASVGALDPSMKESEFASSLKGITKYLYDKAKTSGLNVSLPDFATPSDSGKLKSAPQPQGGVIKYDAQGNRVQ